MPRCPNCGTESDRVVRETGVEVRGKRFVRSVLYCTSCGVKFTTFRPGEEPAPAAPEPADSEEVSGS